MKTLRTPLVGFVAFLGMFATFALASSKISDDAYRLVRQLVSYKNREIDMLKNLNQYTLDCSNVSDAEFAAKKCTDRMSELQSQDRDLQVKHDVFGHDLQAYLRQHKDEEWLFMGLMLCLASAGTGEGVLPLR